MDNIEGMERKLAQEGVQGVEKPQLSPTHYGMAETKLRTPEGQASATLVGGVRVFERVEDEFEVVKVIEGAGEKIAAEENEPCGEHDEQGARITSH